MNCWKLFKIKWQFFNGLVSYFHHFRPLQFGHITLVPCSRITPIFSMFYIWRETSANSIFLLEMAFCVADSSEGVFLYLFDRWSIVVYPSYRHNHPLLTLSHIWFIQYYFNICYLTWNAIDYNNEWVLLLKKAFFSYWTACQGLYD